MRGQDPHEVDALLFRLFRTTPNFAAIRMSFKAPESVTSQRPTASAGGNASPMRNLKRGSEPEDAAEFLRAVAQQVTSAYMHALEDRRTRLGVEVAEEAIKTGVSFIPGVGPLVEKATTLTQLTRQASRERRSWTSAIFTLTERSKR
jgi:hypothetical protein